MIDGFNADDTYEPYNPIAEMTGLSYKKSKILWLSLLYGAGKPSVKKLLQCDTDEAQDVIYNFNEGMPEMAEYKEKLNWELSKKGYIEDFYGRKYPAPSSHSFKLPNLTIQGTACGTLKKAMLKVDPLLKDMRSNLLQLIHDEMVFEIHVDEIHLVDLIIEAMEYDHGFAVPMRVKAEYTTTNWTAKQEWKGSL